MRGSLISERNEMKRKWQWHATRSRVYRDSTCSTRVPIWMKFEIANSILIDLRFVIDLRSSAWKWCRYLQAKRSLEKSNHSRSATSLRSRTNMALLVDLAIVNLIKRNTLCLLNRKVSIQSLSNENTFYLKQYTALNTSIHLRCIRYHVNHWQEIFQQRLNG